MSTRQPVNFPDIQFKDPQLNRLRDVVRALTNETQQIQAFLRGGDTDEVLAKVSPGDYDITWSATAGGDGNGAWHVGHGAPPNTLGVNGDMYLDASNGNVYQKITGAYALVANISGPSGPSGSSGAAGAPGAPGSPGTSGNAGRPGKSGEDGDDGRQGPPGPPGPAGGPVGPTGPAGRNGLNGSPGRRGEDAEDGRTRIIVQQSSSQSIIGIWNKNINESGGSLANFNTVAGTNWSVSGGKILLNDNTNTDVEIVHKTLVDQSIEVLQVDIDVPSAGQFNNTNQFAGLAFFADGGSVANSLAIGLFMNNIGSSSGVIAINHVGVANLANISFPFTLDTTYTLRIRMGGGFVAIFINGTIVGGYQIASAAAITSPGLTKVGLYGHNIEATFANFQQWSLNGP